MHAKKGGRIGKSQHYVRSMISALAAFACAAGVAAAGPAQILLPAQVKTDSCGYEYENKMLCDGMREPLRWQEAWLSSEWSAAPRWVEVAFTSDVPVRTVAIFWGVDEGRPASSRHYAIEAWRDKAFTNILDIRDNPQAARSVHTFDEVTSKRFRVWQPAGGGSPPRTNAMWIAEIELYGSAKPDAEFGTAADLAEVRRFRQEVRDRTIGVFRRSRSYVGRTGAIAKPLMRSGWRVIQLNYLDERELGLCRAAVMCGTRAIPNMDVLAEYVSNGGGMMFIYDSCGRGPGSVFPDIWEFTGMAKTCNLTLTPARHPITRGITNAIRTTYGEYAVLKAGSKGTALVRDSQGCDVVVVGRHGNGRAVAIGTFPGMSSGTNWNESKMVTPGDGEYAIISNAVQWLTQDTKLRYPWEKSSWAREKKPGQTLFENVTDACGMTYGGYSKNVAIADVNGDGRPEIFATQCKILTADPYYNLLYRNDGDWKFTEIGGPAGVTLPYGIGSAFGDMNGDGNLDLFVSWMPEMASTNDVSALFLGNGKCGFRNATQAAGLGNLGKVSICMLADIDNDGDLDLYVVGCAQENRMYRNRGDGTFEDATAAMGLTDLGSKGEKGYGGNMACAMGDLNGDGYVDLVAYNRSVLHVLSNDAGKTFAEHPDYMGAGQDRISGGSLGLALGDYDNDGDLDIYVAGRNALLRNDGNFRFTDATPGSGLDAMKRNYHAYGTAFVDWNNDGWLDLFLANGGFDSFAFQNNGDGTFADRTGAIGLDVFGVHGFNFGDLDGDGDLDFYATAWAKYPSALLRNNLNDGNALTIRVKGRKTNTSGIGAKVWVYEEAGTNTTRRLRGYREVRSGGGAMYSGAILEQHVGVPRGGRYTVEVLFPVSGKRVTLPGVTAPQVLAIEEP
ncbi:MAG: VCBS repeat-containing protein [Kiritimatiellae bacterium]|nr:VCBS repeat-containing protein [Kiritimatiellia bacterium]